MNTVIGQTLIAPPCVGSTQTFITVGAFDTEIEAVNCNKYLHTKFCRCMLSTLKITQDNKAATWSKVPLQDFTPESDIDWSQEIWDIDAQLYRKYGLTQKEIDFIERYIEYRDEALT